MNIHEYIRRTRETLGLTLQDLAERVGISLENMRDIEDYEDEIFEAVEIQVIRSIAEALHVPPSQMLGIQEGEVPLTSWTRNELIRFKRQEKQMSQETLADFIGFDPEVIHQIEQEPDALDYALPYSAVITLSETIEIPLSILLKI